MNAAPHNASTDRSPFEGVLRSLRRHAASLLIAALALAFISLPADARTVQEIELTDGSVIAGEVVSLLGDTYTIKSPTLGTLKIDSSKIRIIRMQGSAAPRDTGSQVKSLEDRMLSDGDIMDTIRALQNDPDLQKILQDPEIMQAVQSGDIAALMRNPDFMKLLNKQAVQDINRKLAR